MKGQVQKIDYLSSEHKLSLGLHDKGMCVNCVRGACLPSEVSYNGAKLQVTGCVAAILHYSFPDILTSPEKCCSCFYENGEKGHPKDKFVGIKLYQAVLPTDSDIGSASSGLAMVDKDIVEES